MKRLLNHWGFAIALILAIGAGGFAVMTVPSLLQSRASLSQTRVQPVSTHNAELAAWREVWVGSGEAHWATQNIVRITCTLVSPGMASCRATAPGHPLITLQCDNGQYPFNDGCVWLDDSQDWRAP
jgi:hypothetical protein